MARALRISGIVAALAVLLTTLALATPSDAGVVPTIRPAVTSETAREASAPVAKKKPNKPGKFSPWNGTLFNNANGGRDEKYNILDKIIASINSAPRGSSIRIATWSYFEGRATDALIRAHQRGVSVRLVMARQKSFESHSFKRLRAALKGAGNSKRTTWSRRSGVHSCESTCRGRSGTMHTKMFIFSQAGKSKDVVMWGSPNLTTAAARLQWNDLYMSVGKATIYDYASQIWNQLWQDKPVATTYKIVQEGAVGFGVLPWKGSGDWVSEQLKKVRCNGATGGAGVGGHTNVLVAQAVIRGSVGDRIATYLKKLWDQGCSVRILYTIRGGDARKILIGKGGRGPVPMRHYVQDLNGDGIYDKYLHMKMLLVSGVMGTKTNTAFVMNGSENWTNLARMSDEEVGYFQGRYFRKKYTDHFNWLWNHVPKSVPFVGLPPEDLRLAPVDPYAHVDQD